MQCQNLFRIMCLVGVLLCFACGCLAAPLYQPGFRTLGCWSEEPEMRLDMNVWYPCARASRDLNFTPWTIRGALNAKCARGKFPLLIISHPSPGNRFSYHELAAVFASSGYVVAAPTHGHDNMDNMDDLFTWGQMEKRVREIDEVIRRVLDIADIGPNVDKSRIGIAGFGAGGTAALLLGGALPDCSGWPGYCRKAGGNDVYCSPWARDKINSICAGLPLAASLADRNIQAVAAISPAYGMLFGNESFRYFYPPVLLVGAGRETFDKMELHSEPLARILGRKAHYMEIPNADAGAMMSACPPGLAAEMAELCLSATPEQRREVHGRLADILLLFFNKYLVEPQTMPQLPGPPDLAPADREEPKIVRKPGKKTS